MGESVVYDSMSISRTIVPPIDRLKKLYESMGELEFVKLFESYETLVGSTESIAYIQQILANHSK